MQVRFGWALDRGCGRAGGDRLGRPVLGPAGMLELLETQLGIAPPQPGAARRLVAAVNALHACRTPARFWAGSFAVDAIGTAADLLAWRDRWWLHGWDGAMPADAPARLRDLADFEAALAPVARSAAGDRLAAIEARLPSRRPSINALRLCSPRAALPRRWQRVLSGLPCSEEPPLPPVEAATDLGRLQGALLGLDAGRPLPAAHWRGDGSVQVLQAGSRLAAVRWFAAARAAAGDRALLVLGADAALADAAGVAAGLPCLGVAAGGADAPALTLLPLALALLWQPLDSAALLAFLVHPLCPLPAPVRHALARTVAERPGIGGPAWQATLARCREAAGEEAQSWLPALGLWLSPPVIDPAQGAPLALLRQRAGQLAQDCMRLPEHAGRGLRLAAGVCRAQALAFAAALAALDDPDGSSRLRAPALARLLAAVDRSLPGAAAGAGAPVCITDPEAAIDPWPAVLWWQPLAPALPEPGPWSPAERLRLAGLGVDLPDPAQQRSAQVRAALRPMLAARTQLTLVLPAAGVEPHPLMAALADWLKTAPGALLTAAAGDAAGACRAQPLVQQPLAGARRWWRLPAGRLRSGAVALSQTSVSELIEAPHVWVLRRCARLEAAVLQPADGARLYGLLVHRLAEQWFAAPDALAQSPAALATWFGPAFDALLACEGAPLGLPGRAADRAGLRRRAARALQMLQATLGAFGAVEVHAEHTLTGPFAGVPCEGRLDLLARDRHGRQLLIDLKWTPAAWLHERLAAARHVQLAVYAGLLCGDGGVQPAAAYAALPEARLLAPAELAGVEVWTVPAADGSDTAGLRARAEAAWRWRQAQLAAGCIEIPTEGMPSAEAAEVPAEALQPKPWPLARDPYRSLLGVPDGPAAAGPQTLEGAPGHECRDEC